MRGAGVSHSSDLIIDIEWRTLDVGGLSNLTFRLELLCEDLVLLVISGGVINPHLAGGHSSQQAINSREHFLDVRRLRQSF